MVFRSTSEIVRITVEADRMLYVYECRGTRLPEWAPEYPGFLGIWREPPFYYLFFESEAADCVSRWITGQPGWILEKTYEIPYDHWQQAPEPLQCIGPFTVFTGAEPKGRPGILHEKSIRIDPGVVFGSGVHSSTRGCLLALAHMGEWVRGRTVVDFGTGTGILAVAAGLLGASRVVAIDCNPMAARTAAKNIRLNGLQDRIHPVVADQWNFLKEPSNLLLMNIEVPVLLKVIGSLERPTSSRTIMSGFLTSQWPDLRRQLPQKYSILHQEHIDGWETLSLSAD